ncbi:hypothetical protein A3Q56_07863 [Intoshia linei]|uniref:Translin-associated factor X-interacting protein 1 N-terminal domain-containing protein n=1 Tax=Intoshia linei TaxID=1819745 RepID=A0A177AR15_9BILA|nr:hypothetical protein A3Q56_07863 [Intoshia linei]
MRDSVLKNILDGIVNLQINSIKDYSVGHLNENNLKCDKTKTCNFEQSTSKDEPKQQYSENETINVSLVPLESFKILNKKNLTDYQEKSKSNDNLQWGYISDTVDTESLNSHSTNDFYFIKDKCTANMPKTYKSCYKSLIKKKKNIECYETVNPLENLNKNSSFLECTLELNHFIHINSAYSVILENIKCQYDAYLHFLKSKCDKDDILDIYSKMEPKKEVNYQNHINRIRHLLNTAKELMFDNKKLSSKLDEYTQIIASLKSDEQESLNEMYGGTMLELIENLIHVKRSLEDSNVDIKSISNKELDLLKSCLSELENEITQLDATNKEINNQIVCSSAVIESFLNSYEISKKDSVILSKFISEFCTSDDITKTMELMDESHKWNYIS